MKQLLIAMTVVMLTLTSRAQEEEKGFALGLNYSAYYNQVTPVNKKLGESPFQEIQDVTVGAFSNAIGLSASWRFHAAFSVDLGVGYAQLHYGSVLFGTSSPTDPVQQFRYKKLAHYISIPLWFHYHFLPHWSVGAGWNSNLLIKSSTRYLRWDADDNKTKDTYSGVNEYQPYYGTAGLQVAYRNTIGRFQYAVAPYASVGIGEWQDSEYMDFKTYQFGVNLTLQWRFNGKK